jgi:hypothetical protein
MAKAGGRQEMPPRARTWRLAVLGSLAAVTLAALLVEVESRRADAVAVETAPSASRPGPAARRFALDEDDGALPDDIVLRDQLDKAIDLRRREDFDRMLDARDPGELIEHATLTEVDFDHRNLGIDTLFIVGDELFGYLFRPENGWGGKAKGRDEAGFTPSLRRVHQGNAGGPDAFGCFSCHMKGGPDGAGTQTQNAFLTGDGARIRAADQRNPPHLLGLGPVALLAAEMTAELKTQAEHAREQAAKQRSRVEQELNAKGVSFGRITAEPSGAFDFAALEGVDQDLTVRPFGWKGHQATLRDMAEESLHIHQGLLSNRIQLAVRDRTLDNAPYGSGPWSDVDEDGVSLEIDSGMLTTVVGYLAQLEAPVIRPPRDPGLLDAFAAGRTSFEKIGCAGCHVPTLELKDPNLDARQPAAPDRPPFIINVAKDGDGPKIEPKYAGPKTAYLVHLFSDLKRHDMGDALASPAAQGAIPARVFLTRPLWGLADTAPYLHDGRAPTIDDAITLHGGEAAAARDAYLALDDGARAGVRVFLASLSRDPKLFVP